MKKSILFYPTSPVHIRHMAKLMDYLSEYGLHGILNTELNKRIPGLESMFLKKGITFDKLKSTRHINHCLASDVSALFIGAVFEEFAIELFVQAKVRHIPVFAIQEVAQLSLNNMQMNNYDLPFDKLFISNKNEFKAFQTLNYPASKMCISGILTDIIQDNKQTNEPIPDIKSLYGISPDKKIVLYTTSPLRSRNAIHNLDDRTFRNNVLHQFKNLDLERTWALIVKLHPNEDLVFERQHIQNIIPQSICIGREKDIKDLFRLADAVVNRGNSQTAFDAVINGIPTVILACGNKTVFENDGGAFLVNDLKDLPTVLKKIADGALPDTDFFKANNYHPSPEGTCSLITREFVKTLQSTGQPSVSDWEWMLKTYLFHGNLPGALKLCSRIPQKNRLIKLIEKALSFQLKGSDQKAIGFWKQCATHDPGWFYPYYELAFLSSRLSKWSEALYYSHLAIHCHPPFHFYCHEVPLRILQSQIYRQKNMLYKAELCLSPLHDKSIASYLPEVLIEEALILKKNGDHSHAIEKLFMAFENLRICPIFLKSDILLLSLTLTRLMGLFHFRYVFGISLLITKKICRIALNGDFFSFLTLTTQMCLSTLKRRTHSS